jgi:hypothetical protein
MASNIVELVGPRESVGRFVGPAVVIPVLKAVRRARGIETALRCAEEMIVATASIIAERPGTCARSTRPGRPRVASAAMNQTDTLKK